MVTCFLINCNFLGVLPKLRQDNKVALELECLVKLRGYFSQTLAPTVLAWSDPMIF